VCVCARGQLALARRSLFPVCADRRIGAGSKLCFAHTQNAQLTEMVVRGTNVRGEIVAGTRHRRQFNSAPPTQIDLNITVPFIFSARLYPYGEARGDSVLPVQAATQPIVLRNEIVYLAKNYSIIHVRRAFIVCVHAHRFCAMVRLRLHPA
jgi:hypothetical protein